ncbi:hypothetical protein ABVT39_005634 [Epinephelus coioides]
MQDIGPSGLVCDKRSCFNTLAVTGEQRSSAENESIAVFLHSTKNPPLSYFSDSAVRSEKSERPLSLFETSGHIASDHPADGPRSRSDKCPCTGAVSMVLREHSLFASV